MKKKNMMSWIPWIQKKNSSDHSMELYNTTRNDNKRLTELN